MRMQGATPEIAYFGKIPTHGDFIRRNAASLGMRAMDAWLQEGLYYAHALAAFNVTYDAARACLFYFSPRDLAQVLVGVICPSRDSVGRTYPFLVAFEAEARSVEWGRLVHVPVAYEAFYQRASALACEAAAGRLSHHELAEQTDGLGRSVDGAGRASAFQAYLQQTPLTEFWTRLWGHPEDSRKYLLFKNLLDIILPLRHGIPSGFPLALRFPLSTDDRTPAFDASFWLEVCLRLSKAPPVRPSFFWTLPREAADAAPFLLLTLRPPPAKTFMFLLPTALDSDTLCDLEKMGGQSAALAALSIPASYGELLEAEHLTLADFLQRLEQLP